MTPSRSSPLKDSSTDSLDLSKLEDAGAPTETVPRTGDMPAATPGQSEVVEANVILISHPEKHQLGTRFRVRPGTTIEIGRKASAEICVPEVLTVSRVHARVDHRGTEVFLEDLGSTNGTYINDRRISGPVRLTSGDRFQVGSVHFKFLHERDVESAYHTAIYELATSDGLTEVHNKRKFDEELTREIARAGRYGRPLALILVDIDHFKRVNDTYGHLCGDVILKRIAQSVDTLVRAEQVLARVGGEEFAVLCPETTGEQARVLAERAREMIEERTFEHAGFEIDVTCSFGVVEYDDSMASEEDFYSAADEALYASKQRGRNRVTVFSDRGGLRGATSAG